MPNNSTESTKIYLPLEMVILPMSKVIGTMRERNQMALTTVRAGNGSSCCH